MIFGTIVNLTLFTRMRITTHMAYQAIGRVEETWPQGNPSSLLSKFDASDASRLA